MILVVADTTPLHYLVEIGYEYLLLRLFTKVWIPGMVASELRHERTPVIVRQWAEHLPPWIEVGKVDRPSSSHELAGLDRGEWEAIEPARELHANLLLIDERTGVRVARDQGFTVTGTLGVLVEAARLDIISIEVALERLARTNFRRTPTLFAETKVLVRKSGKSGGA